MISMDINCSPQMIMVFLTEKMTLPDNYNFKQAFT